MTRRSRVVYVRLRLILALVAAALFPMVAGGATASAAPLVPYQFDGLAFYQFNAPGDLCCGPGGNPDTGFVRITNNGASTFIGNIGFNAMGGFLGNFNSSYPVTLIPGAHFSFSINNESSNQGGYNGPYNNSSMPQDGAQFFMDGTVLLGADSQTVSLSKFDKDIHSGVFRTNPFGVNLDNYILQGGDSLGRDTGDGFETTQASGTFQFAQAAPSEQAIGASGQSLNLIEGAGFTGTIAVFGDPDAAATASEYTATIDWGDGSPIDTGVIGGGSGIFGVSGTHTYADEGSYSITVVITDVDNASNTATANSTANVADAALGSSCATPGVSSMSFSGSVANITDVNPQAAAADFTTVTISWGDGASSAGTVSGPTGGPFTVSGSHTYSSTGPESISVTVTDDGGSTTSVSGCVVLIFAGPASGGAFVIGDGNSAIGTAVTFWGPQWSKLNTLSGGPASASFKGFALSPASPSCGTGWTTDPGNSAPPPAGPLPAFMSVIVTSSSSMSGSQISGNTVHVVIVRTNGDYAPAVGHAGTGTVVAQVC